MNMGERKDRRAEMGVGTLIIFVCVILIASIASSVLIESTDLMGDETGEAGDSALTGVSTYMSVDGVLGLISNDDQLDQVNIYVRLGSGSPSINMSSLSILVTAQYEGGSMYETLSLGDSVGTETFTAEWIQDRNQDSYLDEGEFVKIQIGQNGTSELNLEKGCTISVVLMPKTGSLTTLSMDVPANEGRGFFEMR